MDISIAVPVIKILLSDSYKKSGLSKRPVPDVLFYNAQQKESGVLPHPRYLLICFIDPIKKRCLHKRSSA